MEGKNNVNKRITWRSLFRTGMIAVLLLMLLFTACGKKKAEVDASSAAVSQSATTGESASEEADGSDDEKTEEIHDNQKNEETAEAGTENPKEGSQVSFGEDEAEEKSDVETADDTADENSPAVVEDGTYNTKEEVAAYIHMFGHLPSNYISKKEAERLGWDNREGNLDEVAPGMSIGGGKFGNYEGLLPEKKGRKYYECDINYTGGYRGPERIVFSDDGLIFYTADHYKTFEQLY